MDDFGKYEYFNLNNLVPKYWFLIVKTIILILKIFKTIY